MTLATDRDFVGGSSDFATIAVAGQHFAIPVKLVKEVFVPKRITRVPLSSDKVAGVLNLRGRVLTAIDARRCLGLPARGADKPGLSICIERDGGPYGLIVDGVGDVVSLDPSGREQNPANLNPSWRRLSLGVHRLDGKLLILLDVGRLLEFAALNEAA